MLRRLLPAPLIGVLTVAAMSVALLFWGGLILLPVALLKILLPVPTLQRRLAAVLVWIAGVPWVGSNKLIFTVLHGPRENVVLEGAFDPRHSWLIVSNHKSWADILILFDVFWLQLPFPRFFLKQQLIWIPLVGLICWALEMPFMKRHSKTAIVANPELKREDLETTRRFCERFRGQPVAVVDFLEGTRCSDAKRLARGSPYRHLLRPKSGALGLTLHAMGEQFAGIVDVTLDYVPSRRPHVWSFLCGEQFGASVRVRALPIPAELIQGNYEKEPEFRRRIQSWTNALWLRKDSLLAQQHAKATASAVHIVAGESI